MKIEFNEKNNGKIRSIEQKGNRVLFGEDIGPSFYYKKELEQIPVSLEKCNDGYRGTAEGIEYRLSYEDGGDHIVIKAEIENKSSEDFCPEAVGLKLGVDSYMVSHPQWNDKYFPTFLRCEKTHFWGYFMAPTGKLISVICKNPVAAWELDYNTLIKPGEEGDNMHFGHRIYTANLLLLCRGPLPERHPEKLDMLRAGEKKAWEISLMPLESIDLFRKTAAERFGIPVIDFDRYTVAKGETAKTEVLCGEKYSLEITSPSGKVSKSGTVSADEYGAYAVKLLTESGLEAQALVYCRHPYRFYMENARKNAVIKPQKASTHCESWYGHFSSFLAAKHYPDDVLDKAAKDNFDEILPLMFNIDKGEPITAPERIQNTALMISMLVDLYEADRKNNRKYLELAGKLADYLIGKQKADGAYYRNGTAHYTAVIYIAKGMLELALLEKELSSDDAVFFSRYEKHYASAKAAVDNLKELLETIGTEGEHTLEDGMISCSALQLGFFALTLPENERAPYIEAAEHMMSVHRCLEQQIIPDCRMRGATLRFWEAQYDALIRGNMMNSPHGWTSWKTYATYYLYLLTGKEEYLRDTVDTLGACLQCLREDGELFWAFISDPYLNVRITVPDTERPIEDGYESAKRLIKLGVYQMEQACRSKYERRIFGETYIPMISGWYRICPESPVTGGYPSCPLMLADKNVEVDPQGSCCDNDVHEHFKCLEETLLKKAFVIVRGDGSLFTHNCTACLADGIMRVSPLEDCKYLHVNTCIPLCVIANDININVEIGMTMLNI